MKTAFVTGASRGIGFALTEELLSREYEVFLVARDEKRLEKAKSELKAQFPQREIITFAMDVSDAKAVSEAVKKAFSHFKKIDVVINNAGTFEEGSAELSKEQWERLMATNLSGPFYVVHETVPHLKKQKYGYLINVSSTCGVHAFAGIAGYCASKYGLIGLSHSLFKELVPFGIKVTALCPSWVATEKTANGPFPQSEMIQPRDLGKTLGYLLDLSPHACPREMVIECLRDTL